MLGPYELDTIITGDARELAKAIPDESVDCIFADPPYLKQYLPLYGDIAEFAARILKPAGFCMLYNGQYHKDKVMLAMGQHLEYFWDFVLRNGGDRPVMWQRKILAADKSLLCYRPKGGKGLPRVNVISGFDGSGKDKRYHVWGQDALTARYYIDCFTLPGDVVLDCCMGGGTTGYVCKQLDRRFVGFEFDAKTADIARARVTQYQPFLIGSGYDQLSLGGPDNE